MSVELPCRCASCYALQLRREAGQQPHVGAFLGYGPPNAFAHARHEGYFSC